MVPGKPLLRQDIANGLHLKQTISELHKSRPEYVELERKKFGERVRQEAKRAKYMNYLNNRANQNK